MTHQRSPLDTVEITDMVLGTKPNERLKQPPGYLSKDLTRGVLRTRESQPIIELGVHGQDTYNDNAPTMHR